MFVEDTYKTSKTVMRCAYTQELTVNTRLCKTLLHGLSPSYFYYRFSLPMMLDNEPDPGPLHGPTQQLLDVQWLAKVYL